MYIQMWDAIYSNNSEIGFVFENFNFKKFNDFANNSQLIICSFTLFLFLILERLLILYCSLLDYKW